MLFCDNGHKPAEWNRFVPLLAPGDFAAVHDWGTEFGPEDLDPPSPRRRIEVIHFIGAR